MAIELPSRIEDIPEQAADRAERLRGEFGLGDRGIRDLFKFVETALGYLLFRYPFGEDSIQGFAAPFRGERLIVTNSSQRLGRELFTLAHEIAHHIFDLDENQNRMISDVRTGEFSQENLREYRADWFAACFLMPEKGVKAVFRELRTQMKLSPRLVILMQEEFSVSYTAMVRRLRDLQLISEEEWKMLNDYYLLTGQTLTKLTEKYGGNTQLLERSNIIHVPRRYLECLLVNYENGWISYDSLRKTLALVDLTPEDVGIEPRTLEINDEDDDSVLDDLLTELDER